MFFQRKSCDEIKSSLARGQGLSRFRSIALKAKHLDAKSIKSNAASEFRSYTAKTPSVTAFCRQHLFVVNCTSYRYKYSIIFISQLFSIKVQRVIFVFKYLLTFLQILICKKVLYRSNVVSFFCHNLEIAFRV